MCKYGIANILEPLPKNFQDFIISNATYSIKTDIRYDLLPNLAALKLFNYK